MEEATPLTVGPAPPLPEQASLPHPQLCTRQAGICVRGRRPSPHPLQPTGRWGPFLSRPPCPVYKADGDNPFPGAAAAVAPPAPIITSLANRPRGLPGAHQGTAGLGTSREAGPGRQPHTAALTVLRPGGPGCTVSTPVGLQPLRPSLRVSLWVGILEPVAIPFSRGSSSPRDRTRGSCIAGRFFAS